MKPGTGKQRTHDSNNWNNRAG